MFRPKLAYLGDRERDTINPEGTTERFIYLLSVMQFDREELTQLTPSPAFPASAKPFSIWASSMLAMNDSNRDLTLEG